METSSTGPDSDIADIREGEEFNEEAVLDYLSSRADALCLERAPTAMEVFQFPGGRANLTYLLKMSGREFVLRRPPLGKVGPGAHDMGREFKVLSRLWQVYNRAPRAFLHCEDTALIGAQFFVMERREGSVIRFDIPAEMSHHENVGQRVSFALVDAFIDLHRADYRAADLANLGRPDGFLGRQLSGWSKRWELSKTEELPDFDRLANWLASNIPADSNFSLIHNDPKLDNCQFDPSSPDRVTSLFDWDMTTIGPSLVDLGTLLAYWTEAQGQTGNNAVSALSIFAKPGFPAREEIAEYYADKSGAKLDEIAWYEAFALWKSAVVGQQIYARYKRGDSKDKRFARMAERVPQMLATGLQRAAK